MTRPARNGVDVPSVFAVIEGVKGQSGMAQFQFRPSGVSSGAARRTSAEPSLSPLTSPTRR